MRMRRESWRSDVHGKRMRSGVATRMNAPLKAV